MTERGQRSISKIRTFGGDVSRAKGTSATLPTTPAPTIPSPLPSVTTSNAPVPLAPQAPHATEVPPSVQVPPQSAEPAPSVPQFQTPQVDDITIDAHLHALGATVMPQAQQPLEGLDDPLGEAGTIVTDKRRKRFKLLPAIGTAVSDWANEAKTNLTKAEAPVSINTVESRLDTLRAAASASHHVPQDDHGVLLKRIAEAPRQSVAPTTNIKAASSAPLPTWKHVAPSEPEQSPAPAAATPAAPPPVVPEEVAETLPQIPVAPTAVAPAPVTQVTARREPILPRVAPPASAGYANFQGAAAEAVPLRVPLASARPYVPPMPVNAAPPGAMPHTEPLQATAAAETFVEESVTPRTRRTVLMFTLVIFGASLLGIGTTTLWYLGTRPAPEVAAPLTAPSVISATLRTPVAISANRTDTLNALLTATLATSETQQIYLTANDGSGNVVPAPAPQIFTALSFRLPGNFSRSVRTINFGGYAGEHPFIVMHTGDFSTAFAGMLAWEPTMSADLVPLFGIAVNESFDPTARTASQVRSAFFRDTVIANVSARVLVNAGNEERIVYGFVKPSVILIAPNEATFTAIAPLVIETP